MKRTLSIISKFFFLSALVFTSCSKIDQPSKEKAKEQNLDNVKVIVGICKSGSTHQYSTKCLMDAGAFKVDCFPLYARDVKTAKEYIDRVDALLAPGSTSSDEPNRGECDDRLIEEAIRQGKPVFGICFGCQHINKVLGGSTIAVKTAVPQSKIDHHAGVHTITHSVTIKNNTKLAEIYPGVTTMDVNSSHTYVIDPKKLGTGVTITALSEDGLVEGCACNSKGCFGVQWHPEYMYGELGIKEQLALFETFVHDAKVAKLQREEEED